MSESDINSYADLRLRSKLEGYLSRKARAAGLPPREAIRETSLKSDYATIRRECMLLLQEFNDRRGFPVAGLLVSREPKGVYTNPDLDGMAYVLLQTREGLWRAVCPLNPMAQGETFGLKVHGSSDISGLIASITEESGGRWPQAGFVEAHKELLLGASFLPDPETGTGHIFATTLVCNMGRDKLESFELQVL